MSELARKLGIKSGFFVCLLGGNAGEASLIKESCPEGVILSDAITPKFSDMIFFWPMLKSEIIPPDKDAGCSLEESCPADKLAEFQKTNPNFWTVAYINCSADVKALSDVICTSGNAVKIVEAAPEDKDLLFVPDENLGAWVTEQTGRPMTLWRGNCYAHVEFRREALLRLKEQFPQAKEVVHPESLREVRDLADAVCSTEKMITYCKTTDAKQFVIVTESGIIHRMRKECPGKEFICAPTFDVSARRPTPVAAANANT